MKPKKELIFLDSAENRAKVRKYFYIFLFLGILLIIDFLIPKHGHFSWETAPEFYAVYGFVACVCLILISKALRLLVKRKEDYYD
jgi:hypothetical protein